MRRTLTSLGFLAALAGSAFADDARVVKSVSLQDLQAILIEEGYTINSTGDDGEVSVRATDTAGTGLIFNLLGAACEHGSECGGNHKGKKPGQAARAR